MGCHLHIMQATGRLNTLRKDIEACTAIVSKAVSACATLPQIDVIIVDQPENTIPDDGIGGFCGEASLITMSLDPTFDQIDFAPNGAFARALVHETHHALRWAKIGYGTTLGAALVSEGLAGHFVHEVLGTLPEPWECAVNEEDLERLCTEAVKHWVDVDYDHAAWFFGTGDQPHWGGYTLGFHLVKQFLATHPDSRPSQLAGLSPDHCKPL